MTYAAPKNKALVDAFMEVLAQRGVKAKIGAAHELSDVVTAFYGYTEEGGTEHLPDCDKTKNHGYVCSCR